MPKPVRNARPSDRDKLIAQGLSPESVDGEQLQIVVASTGAQDGFATFLHGDKERGTLPVLYIVETRVINLRLFWQLIDHVAERMIEAGFSQAECVLHGGSVLEAGKRDTELTFEPVGTNVKTGKPAYFHTFVPDLAAFRRSIEKFV